MYTILESMRLLCLSELGLLTGKFANIPLSKRSQSTTRDYFFTVTLRLWKKYSPNICFIKKSFCMHIHLIATDLLCLKNQK